MDERIILPLVTGFVVGIFTRWPLEKLAERRAFKKGIAEKYIEAALGDTKVEQDEFWRCGALQKLGAADLYPWELNWVCDRIVARGLKDPRTRMIPLYTDKRRKLRKLLKWAAKENISLGDGDAFLSRHAAEVDAWVQGSGRKP